MSGPVSAGGPSPHANGAGPDVRPDLPPGVAGLIGAGVWHGVPAAPPAGFRDGDVLVAGAAADAVPVACHVSSHCARVVVVTCDTLRTASLSAPVRQALRAHGNVTVLWRTEIVCAAGIARLEAVVLRHVGTGRISARNASTLVLVRPSQISPDTVLVAGDRVSAGSGT